MKSVAWMSLVALTLLAQGSLSTPVLAAGPQDRVQETLSGVSTILRDPQLQAERKRRVRTVIYDTFYFDEMARESLGSQWERLTPPQQEEFVRLFGQLFENSYNRLVLRFLGDRETNYLAESIHGDRAVVQTMLVGGKDERLTVEYRLASKGQRWGVVDVVLDGVSLAMNYRAQFGKILRTASHETLLERMRKKIE
jgi:phospholipid transport system substrate-binding protein